MDDDAGLWPPGALRERPKVVRRSPSQTQLRRVFANSRRPTDRACKIEFAGLMPESGPMMIVGPRYRRERQLACYELAFGRTRPGDQVVAVCGNPRCLDKRHLHVVPVLKPPKPPRATRARAAGVPATPVTHPFL